MNLWRLAKHTAIYGVATVLPRLLSFILTPLHTNAHSLSQAQYGVYQGVFAYMILGNVLLTYGMETAFFRFMHKEKADSARVQSTAAGSLLGSTFVFFVLCALLWGDISRWVGYPVEIVQFAVAILCLDTLCAIPFAWLRNAGMPLRYSVIKVANALLNLLLNLFFFVGIPLLQSKQIALPPGLEIPNKVYYVFIANALASFFTFVALLPLYFKIGIKIDFLLWKKMLKYAFPVLIAGVAFSINEGFDRIFIRMFYPENQADAVVGIYAGCYKMGVFMTLFTMAYKLGVEPFFFSVAQDRNAPETYARITEYFTVFGVLILLVVSVFTDVLKYLLIPNRAYWQALWIVPFVLLANLCLGIYHSLSAWYKVTDRTHYGAYISVLGGGVTVAGNLCLIPLMGYKGAAVATLLAYASMAVLSFVIGQKKYPIPYKMRKIGAYLLTGITCTWVNYYVLGRNILTGSGFIFLFLGLIFYFERESFPRAKR